MELIFSIMPKNKTVESILDFQTDESSLFWRNQLFEVYSFLNKEKGLKNPLFLERKAYITKELSTFYDKNKDLFQEKKELYKIQWIKNKKEIENIFSNIFQVDCHKLFNNIKVKISLNPICPRYLSKNLFTVFFKFGPEQFLNTSIHELIHFVWFYVWQNHFLDNKIEYEAPHLKWLLSEMVIDTLVQYTDLKYFYKTRGSETPAYNYFYNIKVQNLVLLEKLKELYLKSENIIEFMDSSYQYLTQNEKEIRKQIP